MFKSFLFYFGIIMVLVYIGLGAWILFGNSFIYLSNNIRFAFSFFIIAYGFFRLIRIIIKYKNYEKD